MYKGALVYYLCCIIGFLQGVNSKQTECLDILFSDVPSGLGGIWNPYTYEYDTAGKQFSYHFFHENGTLISESIDDSSRICYNSAECYYLLLSGTEKSYNVRGGDVMKEGVVNSDKPSLIRIGKCVHECEEKTKLVIVGKPGDYYLTYNNEIVIEEEVLTQPTLRKICVDSNSCYKLEGSVAFSISQDDSAFEEGSTHRGLRTIGSNCQSKCSNNPLLTETERGQFILLVLTGVSPSVLLLDSNTNQYRAACWIIYDDVLQLDKSSPTLISRYTAALLYYSTQGANWNYQSHFLSPKQICDWHMLTSFGTWFINSGIFCDGFGDVQQISLESNNLVGVIPGEISSYSSLRVFDLYGNILRGAIPTKFNSLENLEVLSLSANNFLTGSIPASIPNRARVISVSSNSLTGSISHYNGTKLTHFKVNSNNFEGSLPLNMSAMTKLHTFVLSNNNFTGTIPETIVDCKSLDSLNVKGNRIIGTIPQKLFTLENVTQIDLSDNLLTGSIPNEVVESSKISKLDLKNNALTGSIPFEFSKFSNLKNLILNNNALSSQVPSNLVKLENLATFDIQKNEITGTIPFCDTNVIRSNLLIQADCNVPVKVTCDCCLNCFGLYTSYPCSSGGSLYIAFKNLDSDTYLTYNLNDARGNLIQKNSKVFNANLPLWFHNTCISPTNCYFIKFDNETNFPVQMLIRIDERILFEGLVLGNEEYEFGYSSESNQIEMNHCDSIKLCEALVKVDTNLRDAINGFTRYAGIDMIGQVESYQYEAMCHLLKYMQKKSDQQSTSIEYFTRYILMIFYYSTSGGNWKYNDFWTSDQSYCSWYGVQCDNQDLVTELILPSCELNGAIPTETGGLLALENLKLHDNKLLKSIPFELLNLPMLKYLLLNNNTLIGSISSQINFPKLLELDLSSNDLTSTIPAEIGSIYSLEILDLSGNNLAGQLPNQVRYLTELKEIRIGENLLDGAPSEALNSLTKLELLDLKSNYFKGILPINEKQDKLKHIDLSGNKFNGGISTGIEKLKQLEILYLYNNELTGTLPVEIGNLTLLKNMSLSYNGLKGTIPPVITTIESLQNLQLHQNKLIGTLDARNIIFSVSDCGEYDFAAQLVDCPECIYCCAKNFQCLYQARTWPYPDSLLNYADTNLPATTSVLFILLCFFLVLLPAVCFLLRFFLRGKLPYMTFVTREKFQSDSVYKFFLSDSRIAIIIALVQVFLQCWVLWVFFMAADGDNTDARSYSYRWSCPPNSIECDTTIEINWYTPIICAVIIALYLMKDLLDGILIAYEGITISDKRGIFAGCIVVFATVATAYISMMYNLAICTSNTEFYENAAILLFLNDIDEKLFGSLEDLFPSWVKGIDDAISDQATHLEDKLHDKGVQLSIYINEEEDHENESDGVHRGSVHRGSGKIEKSDSSRDTLIENLQFNMEKLQKELLQIKTDLLNDDGRLSHRPNISTDKNESHDYTYHRLKLRTGSKHLLHPKSINKSNSNIQPIITLDEDDEYLRVKHKGAFAYLASQSRGG